MLKHVIHFSLKHSALVMILAGLLLVFAGYQLPRMTVDVFPELNAPTVVVLTEARGYAADEVEQYVSFPVESAMAGLTGVRRVRSGSSVSLSIVWVEFDWGEDIYRARQLVTERLSSAQERLPEGVHTEIAPVTSLTGEIMIISLTSKLGGDGKPLVSDLDLRAYGEYDLTNRLLAVPGIAQVVTLGGELPEYQINANQTKLALYGLTVDDVAAAAREAHSTASAGYLPNVNGLEMPIRQTGRVESVDDIKGTIIRYHNGTPVTIGEVADVRLAGAPKRGAGSEAGQAAVVLSIKKSPGTNTLALTDALDRALDETEKGMPAGITLNRHVMRQSDFISMSLDNVMSVLRDAALFVAIVLVMFLFNVRTTLITLAALPLSLAAALLMLWACGLTINVMTLGGLAVAIGELVDDAIIDVENVFRRLRENRALPEQLRRSHVDVVFTASNEIRSSVVFATIIIVIVFVPLLFLEGLEGRFFRPLGLAYVTSILASLVIALTVTPALCKFLLRGGKHAAKGGEHMIERESFLVRKLKHLYDPILRFALRKRWAIIVTALMATLASLWFASGFGTSFLPEFNEGTFTVFINAPPGTALEESNRLCAGVERRMSAIEGVRSVVRRTGRAERDEHAHGVDTNEVEVTVKPGHRKENVRREIDAILKDIPGWTTTVGQPIEHRLSHILSGTPAAIAINVYGEDLDKLRAAAKDIEGTLNSIPGTRDVAANREALILSIAVRYRMAELQRWGLNRAMASEQVKQGFNGEVVAEVNSGTRRYDLVVRLAPENRERLADVENFLLRGKGGAIVRLRDVADIGEETTNAMIGRENARRKAVVSCNVAEGHNLGHLVETVKEKVDPIVHGKYGYAVEYGGQFEAQQAASRTLVLFGAAVAAVIVMLLTLAFGSIRAALLVMANLPLALIGGIVAVYLTATHNPLANTLALFGIGEGLYIAPVISIAGMVGFITLFGIAIRNGILLVNHYQHLMTSEGKSVAEAVMQGSQERLSPILMTALAALLGLLPIAWAAGEPGSELLAPLATVVLGGLVTSTLLNLIVVPAGFSLIFDRNTRKHAPQTSVEGEPSSPSAAPTAKTHETTVNLSHQLEEPVDKPDSEPKKGDVS